MIPRTRLLETVKRLLRGSPAVLILGPRQCGKTTLAREILGARGHHFDLEDPGTPLRPEIAKEVLAPLRGLVVIDELQRQPSLYELLRVLCDRKPLPARFLLLGSASPDLVRGTSETLAGRVAFVEMGGFDLTEIDAKRIPALWSRGGFPRSLLARNDRESFAWRRSFVQSFLERDIPQLGIRVPAHALRRFWTMLAHYHGQIFNAAELARSMGTSETAVRHYLDILEGSFMVRRLAPWFENVGKRLVKSPKIYLRDSGLLHSLLGLHDRVELLGHPKAGASWEGFALDQTIRAIGAERDAFFYRTHAGAELDLFVMRRGRPFGFELKLADAPAMTKSMHVVLADLDLRHLFVVVPGGASYPLHERVSVVPLAALGAALRRHRVV